MSRGNSETNATTQRGGG